MEREADKAVYARHRMAKARKALTAAIVEKDWLTVAVVGDWLDEWIAFMDDPERRVEREVKCSGE